MEGTTRPSAAPPSQSAAIVAGPTSATGGISLILIAGGDAAALDQALHDSEGALARIGGWHEILVVDPAAEAETQAVVRRAAERQVNARLVPFEGEPHSIAAAVRSGVRAATRPWIALAAGDGSCDPAELPRLAMLASASDVACGYRVEPAGSLRARFGEAAASALARLLLRLNVRDPGCPWKLLHGELARACAPKSDGPFAHAELLARARLSGARTIEVGMTRRDPAALGGATAPRSSWIGTMSGALRFVTSLLRFWWNEIAFPARSATEKGAPHAPPAHSPLLPATRAEEAWAIAALVAAAAVVLFTHLSYPLLEPDEARNAQIALEMHRSGDLVLPRHNGEPYLKKPPLLFWLTSASFHFGGIGETAARLPNALAGLATVLATYLLGRQLVGARAAWIGAMLLLVCGGFVLSARYLTHDVLLTLAVAVGAISLYLGCRGPRFVPGWWLLAGLVCGLGSLTKGPVVLLLCVPPLLAAWWLAGSGVRPRLWHWALFLGPVAGLAIPWYAAIAQAQNEYFGEFFWKHNVVRYVDAFDHKEPWWFYIPVVLIGLFPASLLLPALGAYLASGDPRIRAQRTPELGFLVLCAAWPVLFFSTSSCKLPAYILPAIPLACLALGRVVDGAILPADGSAILPRLARWIPCVSIPICVAAAVAAAIACVILGGSGPLALAFQIAVVGFGGTLLGLWWMADLRRHLASWNLAAAAGMVLMVVAFGHLYPQVAQVRNLSLAVAALRGPSTRDKAPIVYFERESGFARYYVGEAEIREFDAGQVEELLEFAENHERFWLVSSRKRVDELSRNMPPAWKLTPRESRGNVYEVTRGDGPAAQIGRQPAAGRGTIREPR
jgi:4-amino-4-deoxy-L-arabinose transferase-like glycosyltransferase